MTSYDLYGLSLSLLAAGNVGPFTSGADCNNSIIKVNNYLRIFHIYTQYLFIYIYTYLCVCAHSSCNVFQRHVTHWSSVSCHCEKPYAFHAVDSECLAN